MFIPLLTFQNFLWFLLAEEEENVAKWRNKLKDKYLRERKKIRFGKGNQAIADIDDIFVDLSIINNSVRKDIKYTAYSSLYDAQLKSYVDLVRLKTDKDKPYNRILVRGVAGSGKTTLLSRIAYDWAREVENSVVQQSDSLASNASDMPWSKFKLLFLLDIKKIKANTSLEQVIRGQLLPVPEESIERIMSNLGGSCLVLLDGFDEVQVGVDIDDSALCSPLLDNCFVIVTTRPHLVDHFCSMSSGYAIIHLSGFSWENSLLYIKRFFRDHEDLGSRLTEKVRTTPLLCALSSFPILLVMMCILWKHSQMTEAAFKSLTGLYQQAVVYLNKPFGRLSPFIKQIDSILEALGKPALASLFNNSLQLNKSDFEDEAIVEKSFRIGLAYEEECPQDTVVYFIHKTFHEFCSAKYLASLADSDHSLFESHLKKIDENNVSAMEYLLQFTCGLNSKAAVMIFSHVVNLLCTEASENYRDKWFLPLKLLYEMETNGSHSSDTQQMHTVLEQLADHSLFIMWNSEFSYILSHFFESDTHGPNVWLRYVKSLIISQNWGQSNLKLSRLSKYLEHMDSLEELIISKVKFTGASDCDLKYYKTIGKVELSRCIAPAALVLRMLNHMPALQQIEFDSVDFEGSLDPVVPMQFKSIENCTIKGFHNENSVQIAPLKFFSSMDSLKELTVHDVELTGKLTRPMNRLTHLRVEGHYGEYCKVDAQTLMTFVVNMQHLESLSLAHAHIVGDLQDSDIVNSPVSCDFYMRDTQGSASTLVILLSSMKMARSMSLQDFKLSGKFDPLISVSTEHFGKQTIKLVSQISTYGYLSYSNRNTLQGRESKVNALALLNHLQRLPSINEVVLDSIDIVGELQADATEICSQFKSFSMYSGSIRAKTMISLLGRMPSLEKVYLDVCFMDEDMVVENPITLKCVKEATIKRTKHARTLLLFKACMPSLEKLTTEGLYSGEIEESISVTCESLEDFQLHGSYTPDNDLSTTWEERMCRIPSTVIARILQCTPSVKLLSLWGVKLIGKLDCVPLPSTHLSKLLSFKMYRGEICADMLMTFLCSSPKLQRVSVTGVSIVGELSMKLITSCPSVTEFDMEDSTIDVNTLLMYLGCMPSLKTVVFGNIVNSNISKDSEECNSIEKFRMVDVTVDINTLMILLSHMPSLVEVVLDRMILNGEFQDAFECKSVEQFTMRRGSVSSKSLLGLWGSMLPLKKVVLKKVEIQEELLENQTVCCNVLETLHMLDMEVNINTFARFLQSMPCLTTVWVNRIKGELDPGITVSCSELQVIKILSGELGASTLARLLRFMPTLQAITCENLDVLGDTKVSVSLKYVTMLDFVKCTVEMKTLFNLLSFMPSLQNVTLKTITLKGEETGRITVKFTRLTEILVSDTSLKTSFVSQLLNCMSALQKVTLETISFVDDPHMSISTKFKDLTEFTINTSTFSALILQKFLRCMPLLKTLNLDGVSITGEMNPKLSVTCKEVLDFRLSGTWGKPTPLHANTLSHIVACMPSLKSVYLNRIHLQLVTENFATTIGQSVKTIHIDSSEVEPNALLKIMNCLHFLETVQFAQVNFTTEVDSTLNLQCSTKRMRFSRMMKPVRMTILLGFLNYMPLLESLQIDKVDLTGDLDLERIQQCNHLKVASFGTSGFYNTSKFNIETLIRFLAHCTPPIERVVLDNFEHTGEFDGPLSVTCTTLNELTIGSRFSSGKPSTISINALVKALHCLPSLQKLVLGSLDITGDFDTSIPSLNSKSGIKTFHMSGGSLSSGVLAVLLDFFPVVENMTVKLTDQTSTVENICRSMKTLDLSASTNIRIQTNTVVGLIGVMPALEDLKLEKIDSEDIVHDNSLVNGKNVKSVHLKTCSFTADALIRFLRHMQRLERIALDNVNISNDTDTENTMTCQFVEEFDMKSGSINGGALVKLLCCMPQIHKLILCNVTDETSDRTIECEALRELIVSKSNLTASTMTMLMQCMPSLQIIVMQNVNVAGQVDLDIAYELKFVRTYEMNESTISADALLVFLQNMPTLKTVKLCAVQITGEISKSKAAECKSVHSFSLSGSTQPQYSIEEQACSVSATALFVLLGCMVDLEELNLEDVEVLGELNGDVQLGCNKLRKIMMKGGSVSANAIMVFLQNTQAIHTVTLGSTVGEIEVDWKNSATLMLAKELVLEQDKNAGLFSGEKLIRFLSIMPALQKVSIKISELGNMEVGDDVKCENVQELAISVFHTHGSRRCIIGANTLLKLGDLLPYLETLRLKQVDITGELQASTSKSFEMLTDMLMVAVSIKADSLLQYLQRMPALEIISLVEMTLDSVLESNPQLRFKYLTSFNLSGSQKPLAVSAKMLAMMPSLVFLRMNKFELTGDFDCSMGTLGTSLMEVHLSNGTIETVSFFQYLLSLPSLKKLHLSEIQRLYLPDVSIQSKALQEFVLHLSHASALVKYLQRMPYVRKVKAYISFKSLEGTFPLHATFDSVKEFSLTPTKSDVTANTITQLLNCMPCLEKVLLYNTNISGGLTVSNVLNLKSLKEFYMDLNSSARANTIMRLLHKMPVLEVLQLENIKGTLDSMEIGLWKSLKKFLMLGLTVSADTFLKLLSSMPVLEVLTANKVTLDGDVGTSYPLDSILEFAMTKGNIKVTTLVSVVECMPALTKLTLENVQADGNLDKNSPELGEHLAELSVKCMDLELSTCLRMLGRMKALKMVSLQQVQLKGKIHDEQQGVCQSVKELHIQSPSSYIDDHRNQMDVNVPLILMGFMPSIVKMTLKGTYCGEIDVNIQPQCKELKELCLCNVSMNTNSIVHYVNCMPALQQMSLDSVRLKDDLDDSKEISCQSITEFTSSFWTNVSFLEAVLSRQEALTKLKLSSYSELSKSNEERVLAVANSVSSNLKVLELDRIAPVNDVTSLPHHLTAMLTTCLPNLQELHLPNANMTEIQCDKFLEILISTAGTAIAHTPSNVLPLQWLDLSGSAISNSAGKFVQTLAYLGNLKGLILCNCSLEDNHCKELSPSIALLNHLVVLDLSDNHGVSSILAADFRCLKDVQVLKLSGTGIQDEDLTYLPLSQMCHLTELDLSKNPIGIDGIETLMNSVSQEVYLTSDEDTTSDSAVSSSDSWGDDSDSDDSFVSAVSQQSVYGSQTYNALKLQRLSLSDCESIGAKGVECVFSKLSRFPDLEELDLSGIELSTFECQHLPRLHRYLEAVGGMTLDFFDLYDVDQIKSIMNCSFGE